MSRAGGSDTSTPGAGVGGSAGGRSSARPFWGHPSVTNPFRMPERGTPHSVYPVPRGDRSRSLLRRLSVPGLTFGLVMLWIALSPSLLPRAWWMTAVNVGVSLAFGYVVGDLLGRLVGWFARRTDLVLRINARSDWGLRTGWQLLLVVVSAGVWAYGVRQQQVIADLIGVPSGGHLSQLLGLLAGMVIFAVLLLAGRAVVQLWRGVRHLVRPVIPHVVVPVVAAALVLGALWLVSDQVIYRRGMNWALGNAQQLNAQPPEGREVPTEPERSGGPGSFEAWESLGRDGQAFVADGPRAADIEAATGEAAREPVRVYAGKEEHDGVEEAADAAAAELVRAGGLDRSVVLVSTSTGTGFVQEWSVQALEFLTAGDVATVSVQYSYFPSALAYLSDRTTPPEAGRALFDRVEALVLALPEDERPLLLVSGESLGSFGGQGAFDSADDMLARVDGAVWTGTPRFSPLWSSLTEQRREGSPEIAPVVDNGRHVRFATRPEELVHDFYGGPYVEWEEPRIVYGQHASDPIIWWSPALLWAEPDWLREQVGRDLSPALDWAAWVTFWQLATDMPLSVEVPPGHGHEYKDEMVPLWAGVLGMDPTADYSHIVDGIEEILIPR